MQTLVRRVYAFPFFSSHNLFVVYFIARPDHTRRRDLQLGYLFSRLLGRHKSIAENETYCCSLSIAPNECRNTMINSKNQCIH